MSRVGPVGPMAGGIGATGATGTAGATGGVGPTGLGPSYTTTTADFAEPAIGDTVLVTFATTAFMSVGLGLFMGGAAHQVTAISDPFHATVRNLNASAGTVSSGALVTPQGPIGPTGAAGAAGATGATGPAGSGGGFILQWPGDANVATVVAATQWHRFLAGVAVGGETVSKAFVAFDAAVAASSNTAVLFLDEWDLGSGLIIQQVGSMDLSGGFSADTGDTMIIETASHGDPAPLSHSSALRMRKSVTGLGNLGILLPSFSVTVRAA